MSPLSLTAPVKATVSFLSPNSRRERLQRTSWAHSLTMCKTIFGVIPSEDGLACGARRLPTWVVSLRPRVQLQEQPERVVSTGSPGSSSHAVPPGWIFSQGLNNRCCTCVLPRTVGNTMPIAANNPSPPPPTHMASQPTQALPTSARHSHLCARFEKPPRSNSQPPEKARFRAASPHPSPKPARCSAASPRSGQTTAD